MANPRPKSFLGCSCHRGSSDLESSHGNAAWLLRPLVNLVMLTPLITGHASTCPHTFVPLTQPSAKPWLSDRRPCPTRLRERERERDLRDRDSRTADPEIK